MSRFIEAALDKPAKIFPESATASYILALAQLSGGFLFARHGHVLRGELKDKSDDSFLVDIDAREISSNESFFFHTTRYFPKGIVKLMLYVSQISEEPERELLQ